MCRLFGYKTKNSNKTNNLLIKSLKDFRSLAKSGCVPCGIKKGHNDGWGIIAYKDNSPCLYYRSINSITDDFNFTKFIEIVKEIKPDIVVSHLRKISTGLKNIKNTQPFLYNNFSLAHNGTIFYKNINKNKEESDSLLFFNTITKKNISLVNFDKIYNSTFSKNNYTSMNMIFSDGINLFAIKNINNNYPQYSKLCFNKYYTLYSFRGKECDLFCSEKISALRFTKEKVLVNRKIYKL